MPSTLRPGILFDVDGTLFDTNYLHTLTWSRAFADAGEWAPMNSIHRLVGMGSDRLVVELLGHESPEAVDARPRRYQELVGEARPLPGAAELLRLCHHNKLAVVIATSAVSDELDELLLKLGADEAIDAQTTADDISEPKPNPEIFLKGMEAGGIDQRRAIAVGDSVWDVKAARAAGIACIAVESGGYSEHELSEEAPYRCTGTSKSCSISSTPAPWRCSYKPARSTQRAVAAHCLEPKYVEGRPNGGSSTCESSPSRPT